MRSIMEVLDVQFLVQYIHDFYSEVSTLLRCVPQSIRITTKPTCNCDLSSSSVSRSSFANILHCVVTRPLKSRN